MAKSLLTAAIFAAFLFLGILLDPSLCKREGGRDFPIKNPPSSPFFKGGEFQWIFVHSSWASGPTDIGEVEVTAPAEPVSPDKPSAFVSVIDPKPFVNQVKTLPEILSQQVGVNVQQFGGLGQFSTVSIRGSTAEQVTVLMDGVRLNTAQGGAVDFSSIPLDAIDRIEIIRGGATAQFGSDAIGGAINIITKRPKKRQSMEFAVGGGSFLTLKSTEGYSRRFEKWSFLVDHTHLSSKGDYTFLTTPLNIGGVIIGGREEFVRQNNAFFSENGLLKFEGTPSERVRLSLTTDFFGSKREVPPTEEEQVLLSPANPPEARENLIKTYTTFSTEIRSVGLEGLDLKIQPYYHLDFSHFTDLSPGLGGAIDTRYFNQSFGGRMSWTYLWKKGSLLQDLKFTYDLRRELFNDANFINPNLGSGSHARTTNGVYLSDELHLLSDKLLLNPALRFENAGDFSARVALHMGIRGNPLSWLTLKTNIENSFRYPNFNELFYPNQGIFRGNPDLIPEEAINFDVGVGFQHRYGRHEISFFRNWIDNSIIWVPISAFTIAPINTNRVNAQGVEVSTTLSPWSHMDIDANYTFLHAVLEGSGGQLPGRPRHKANVRLTLKNKWGSIYANLLYIDRVPIDFQNTTFITSRAQLDLGLSLNLFKHYYLAAEFKDVTNIQIIDYRGFPLPRFSALGSFGVRI